MRAGAEIAFNVPYMTGKELYYIAQAHFNGRLAGDGPFTKDCQRWLENATGSRRALLTHSCTAALEMAAILAELGPGDEVIMPSFTFVSTANAVVLRGATPVFVDVRQDTLNIDEQLIEPAITSRTRAIMVVHYAGVSCAMDEILAIAARHQLLVIEDSAQGLASTYKGRALGGIGHLGALSFHETKNIISGEGGALLVNDPALADRAEIVREKGTNRSQFFRGEVDKYSWKDIGSSFLPGELVAAFLWAQLQEADAINRRRLALWQRYHSALEALERDGFARRPVIPNECGPNGHLYYLLLPDLDERARVIKQLRMREIYCVFHYVPLHNSDMGLRHCRTSGSLARTESLADRLVRLPLWLGLEPRQDEVIDALYSALPG
jgi:dTDP-4-amino-4,6-dideoxygalactose transaminase